MHEIRRIALQHLESLRRAGLRGLSRAAVGGAISLDANASRGAGKGSSPPAPRPAPSGERRPVGAAAVDRAVAERSAEKPSSAPVRPPNPPERVPVPARPAFEIPSTPAALSLAERRAALAGVCDAVAQCRLCRDLAESRTQTVFGVGNPEAQILFLGEAPGADEDRQGEPFVGRSGRLLDDIIKACKLTREEIYICNVVKCRPPTNRNPTDTEAADCRPFLDAQIALVDPDYIICWGAIATKNLLGKTESVGKLRGRFFDYGRAKVLCTYHPSYLLRNPAAKKDVWEDMKLFRREMGVQL